MIRNTYIQAYSQLGNMSQPNDATLREMASTLLELLKWTRFAGMQQLKSIVTQNLSSDPEMLVYELSDGNRGTREIAQLAGIGSNSTIARYWQKWSKIGLVEPSKNLPGRFQHICSLEELGLTVPQMPIQVQPQPGQGDSNEVGTSE
jgi:hypothetical protein